MTPRNMDRSVSVRSARKKPSVPPMSCLSVLLRESDRRSLHQELRDEVEDIRLVRAERAAQHIFEGFVLAGEAPGAEFIDHGPDGLPFVEASGPHEVGDSPHR